MLDRVTADGRYGVRLGQSEADAEAELRACIAAACAADDFLRDHPADRRDHRRAVRLGARRRRITRCRSAWPRTIEPVTGRRPALLGEPYGADMRLFVNVGDTPCVIFGPGDVKVAHSADEHVPLAAGRGLRAGARRVGASAQLAGLAGSRCDRSTPGERRARPERRPARRPAARGR